MHTLSIGFTPEPDDAFAIYALASGRVPLDGFTIRTETASIEKLNQMASGVAFDVLAISSVHYPHIQDRFAILRVGASVGRGYGPLVVAREAQRLRDLADRTVAVPGLTSTGATLLRLFQPRARLVDMSFESIQDAVRDGSVDAGVLIHQELLNYARSGVQPIYCLGAGWLERTGWPLPVGLNVIRRGLGPETCRRVATALRDSLDYALEHPDEAFEWANGFNRRSTRSESQKFTEMFANDDTRNFGDDCVCGLRELFDRLSERGLAPPVGGLNFVEAAETPRSARPTAGVH